jgi:hypothetical protein
MQLIKPDEGFYYKITIEYTLANFPYSLKPLKEIVINGGITDGLYVSYLQIFNYKLWIRME